MANAAYTPDAGIPLIDATRFAVSDGSFGFTGIYKTSQGKKLAFVSFRGSTNTQDLMDVTDFGDYDDQYYGFWKRIDESFSTWRGQLEALKSRHSDLNDVMFTGHSLGAAESSIAAVMLGEKRPSSLSNMKIHVINFASPRPGGTNFQARFRQHVVLHRRIVNAGDPVTNLPPSAMKYTHVDNGILFWDSGDDIYMVKFDSNNDPHYGGLSRLNYYAALLGSQLGGVFDLGTHGHDMGLYLSRTKEVLSKGARLSQDRS